MHLFPAFDILDGAFIILHLHFLRWVQVFCIRRLPSLQNPCVVCPLDSSMPIKPPVSLFQHFQRFYFLFRLVSPIFHNFDFFGGGSLAGHHVNDYVSLSAAARWRAAIVLWAAQVRQTTKFLRGKHFLDKERRKFNYFVISLPFLRFHFTIKTCFEGFMWDPYGPKKILLL